MLTSIGSNLDTYYKLNKYSNKKILSKDSFTKEILKDQEDKEQNANQVDSQKEDRKEDENITSKIITSADGTRILLLIKNSSVVTQIKLGKGLDEFKEQNQKDEAHENHTTGLRQSIMENEEISNTDTI